VARALLLLTTFATLAAWAGAQGTAPPLSPADRVRLFKTNRTLVENLVNDGTELADFGEDALRRAVTCRRTTAVLAEYLSGAARDQNPDRVAELADLMGVVVRDGLVPNLDEADRTIPAESRKLREQLAATQTGVTDDIDAVGRAIPPGKVGESAKVKAALESLAALKAKVKK